MSFHKSGRRRAAFVALATASMLFAAGCSAGSLGSSEGGGAGGSAGAVTITFSPRIQRHRRGEREGDNGGLPGRQPQHHGQDEHPAGGSEGDNLVKTRLSTGDMAEVFTYNNGSLLAAIKPAQNLLPMDDQPWAGRPGQDLQDSTTVRRKALRSAATAPPRRRGALQHPAYEKLGPADSRRRGMSS